MSGNWRMRAGLALVALCAATTAEATPPLTTIQDTLYKADGTRFDGIAEIDWKSFQASDGSEIPQQRVTVRIYAGSLRVQLVPTTNASRVVVYTVKFNSEGRTQFTEYWSVPPSLVPVRLSAVRTVQQPVGEIVDPGTPGTITDITGLRAELDIRPTKGPGFTGSRAAVINSSGSLDGALGAANDCVRVNGTTGPCGSTGGLTFVDGETPLGSMNGTNTVFTLSYAPLPASSLNVFLNGLLLKQGTDYAVSATVVTLIPGRAPLATDRLQVWYRLTTAGGGTTAPTFVDSEVPQGLLNGSNRIFTLSASPLPAASLQVFRNGLLQKPGEDYNLSGNTVTFLSVSTPGVGDLLQASFRR